MRRVVYGAGPVGELIRARPGSIAVLYVSEKRAKGELAGEAKQRKVSVEVAANRELDRLAGGRHQGLVAVAGDYEYADVDDLLAVAERRNEPALIVALDSVQDPRNVGAIARSAYLLGAHGLMVPRDRAAAVTPAATKASAGATEHLPIAQVTNLARALGALKEAGVWIAAVAEHPDAIAIDQLDASGPLCLVLGAEGAGIRRLVDAACDYRVIIPMSGDAVGSFNVSVAASIALYEIARRR